MGEKNICLKLFISNLFVKQNPFKWLIVDYVSILNENVAKAYNIVTVFRVTNLLP